MKTFLRWIYTQGRFPHARIARSAKISRDSYLGEDTRVLESTVIGSCQISRYVYIGSGCRLERTTIGSFTSIGSEVLCGLATHPLDFVSTYPGFYSQNASGSTWFGASHDFVDQLKVTIAADVWLGSRAIILGGITINPGVVVGAGSIVTKDVPPYAIVAGVPAKIIRMRFPPNVIEALLESRWWKAPKSIIVQVATYANQPEQFLDKLNEIWHYENKLED